MTFDSDSYYWSLVVEEYRTLRDESKQASINMFAAMQWGAAFVGVAMAAGFAQWGKSNSVIAIVFLVLTPLLSSIAMFLWLGEAVRFKRAGDYLAMLEQKVGLRLAHESMKFAADWSPIQRDVEDALRMPHSKYVSSDPIGWEQWLRNTRGTRRQSILMSTGGHQTLIYLFRLAFFPLTMLLSYGIGLTHVTFHPVAQAHTNGRYWWESAVRMIDWTAASVYAGAVIIVISYGLCAVIAWRLSVQAEPFSRKGAPGFPSEPGELSDTSIAKVASVESNYL